MQALQKQKAKSKEARAYAMALSLLCVCVQHIWRDRDRHRVGVQLWEYECQCECEWEGECLGECLGECSLTTLGWLALQLHTHTHTNKYIHYIHASKYTWILREHICMCVRDVLVILCGVPVNIKVVLDKALVQFIPRMYICMYVCTKVSMSIGVWKFR